jgi:hypothetical protein
MPRRALTWQPVETPFFGNGLCVALCQEPSLPNGRPEVAKDGLRETLRSYLGGVEDPRRAGRESDMLKTFNARQEPIPGSYKMLTQPARLL